MARRKRKNDLIDLGLTKSITKDVTPKPNDGLPAFEKVFWCTSSDGMKTKVWIEDPTPDEKNNARKRAKGIEPYRNLAIDEPLASWMIKTGFTKSFTHQVARLFIKKYKDTKISRKAVEKNLRALKSFLKMLKDDTEIAIDNLYIDNVSSQHFIDFRNKMNTTTLTASDKGAWFNSVKSLFSHKSVNSHVSINNIKTNFKNKSAFRPAPEHTSPLAETNYYSDSVMFQLLCYFIYDFERHIDWLQEYESITENDIADSEFLRYEGRKSISYHQEERKTIIKWLSNKEHYTTLIKHEITWNKLWGRDFFNKKIRFKKERDSEEYGNLVKQYVDWVNTNYGMPGVFDPENQDTYRFHIPSIFNKMLLGKKKSGTGSNRIKHRTGYCLVNLIAMATGLNREVIIDWNSTVDGKSILDNADMLFKFDNDVASPQVVISGLKKKIGERKEPKEIKTAIPKTSPLFRMLKQYEKHIKVDFDGKFFEFSKTFSDEWVFKDHEKKDLFGKMYKIILDDGNPLKTLETKMFRKVFGKQKLFKLMEDVNNPIELATKIQEAFNHGNLDTTLSNYIFKEKDARSAIDLAIVTIMESKLNDLAFQGKIETDKGKKQKKELFLCDCEDPSNPTHGFVIAEECTKYDLCLGCHRSVIYAKHLPYICKRILQYEELSKTTDHWSAFFEDRWMIAHDALKQYEAEDTLNGNRLINEAWEIARNNKVSLPPIIMPEFK